MNPKFQGPTLGDFLTDFDRFCTHHHASSIMPCFSAGGWFIMINFTQSSKIPWSHNVNHCMLSVNMTGARCCRPRQMHWMGARMASELQISRRVKNGNSSMQISDDFSGFALFFDAFCRSFLFQHVYLKRKPIHTKVSPDSCVMWRVFFKQPCLRPGSI